MQLPCGVLHLFPVVHLSVLLVVFPNTKVLDVASQEHRYVVAVRVPRLKLLGTTTRPLAYVNNCNIRPVVKSVRFEFDLYDVLVNERPPQVGMLIKFLMMIT